MSSWFNDADYQRVLASGLLDNGPVAVGPENRHGWFSRPEANLDPRLVGPDGKLHPTIRRTLLSLLYTYWRSRYTDPESWSTAWLAGSAVAWQWTGRDEPDLDVLIGVDMRAFKAKNPQYVHMTDPEIAAMFNDGFRHELDPHTAGLYLGMDGSLSRRGNVESWPNGSQQQSSASSSDGTSEVTHSTPSLDGLGGPTTPSSAISSSKGSPSVLGRRDASPGHRGDAETVGWWETLGNARSATAGTNGAATSNGSTASPRKSTTDFYRNNLAVAGFVGEPTSATSRTSSSVSTTTTPLGGFVDSSVGGATTLSGSSVTPSKASLASLNTSNPDGGAYVDVTFFVNPGAQDIRSINPYAAYDITHDDWTVPPVELPSNWDPETYFPKDWLSSFSTDLDQANRYTSEINTIQSMLAKETSEARRVNLTAHLRQLVGQASSLFDEIHLGRKASFNPNGGGFFGYGNARWQFLKKSGGLKALHSVRSLYAQAKLESMAHEYGAASTGDSAATLINKAAASQGGAAGSATTDDTDWYQRAMET